MPSAALPDPALVTGLAFALAFVFGAVAYRVSFCTMGSITDIVTFGDWRRMRMWLLAIAVAIAGATWLEATGVADLSKSYYTGPRVSWASRASAIRSRFSTYDSGRSVAAGRGG